MLFLDYFLYAGTLGLWGVSGAFDSLKRIIDRLNITGLVAESQDNFLHYMLFF